MMSVICHSMEFSGRWGTDLNWMFPTTKMECQFTSNHRVSFANDNLFQAGHLIRKSVSVPIGQILVACLTYDVFSVRAFCTQIGFLTLDVPAAGET